MCGEVRKDHRLESRTPLVEKYDRAKERKSSRATSRRSCFVETSRSSPPCSKRSEMKDAPIPPSQIHSPLASVPIIEQADSISLSDFAFSMELDLQGGRSCCSFSACGPTIDIPLFAEFGQHDPSKSNSIHSIPVTFL